MWTRSIIAVAAALAVAVEGQQPDTPKVMRAARKRATTATTTAPGATHTVEVGAEGFKFTPNQLTDVPVGDIIGACHSVASA